MIDNIVSIRNAVGNTDMYDGPVLRKIGLHVKYKIRNNIFSPILT